MKTETINCTVTNLTKGKLPSLSFVSIKDIILGKKYDLGVTFLKSDKQKEINKNYRNKDETTDILSFPLSKTSGEITFDLSKVKNNAPHFSMTFEEFLKYLFIHGCLHLKGFEHSAKMDKEEKKFMRKFS